MKKVITYIVHPIVLIGVVLFPIKSFSADWKTVKLPGNSSVHISWDNSREVVDRFGRNGDFYGFRRIEPSIIEHAPTGARSASTLPVTIEAQVSRKAVLSGAFGLVKKGAALGSRLSGWGTAAYFAYEAYQAVKSPLESEGYKWDESKGEFIKYWAARNCITIEQGGKNIDVSCMGVDSSVIRAMEKGGNSERDAKKLMESQMQSMANGFWKSYAKSLDLEDGEDVYFWQKFNLQKCNFDLNGGSCNVSFQGDVRTGILFRVKMNDKEILDLEKFLKIATPSIDSNPTPFVEGTGKPEYQENIKVPAGTVVTIGPVTPENGKPVQITITFGQDSNGNTTAEVATTQRPDLKPGGSEAPNTKPDPDPAPNPDGNPDKKPDDKPDSDDKPDKRPDDKPDDDPSDKRKEDKKEDKKDDKKEESKGLLCDFFPKILACDEQPEKEEPNLEIPEEHIDLNFTSDNTFSQFGQCPAPVTFQALGAEYRISLEPACNLAAMMRPFIIAMAWLVASFFVARVVRNNA
ncbi:IgG-binding virulence factor TspB family protein [Neisseria sp. P0008.S004]